MRRLVVAAAFAALPGIALAQAVGSPPTTAFPPPSAPGYKAPTLQPPEQPSNGYTLPPLPRQSHGAPLGELGAAGLFVRRIDVRGVTAIPTADIRAMVAPYENREVTTQELQDLRVALTRLYIQRGYINSGVLLPDQEVKDGVVIMRAIEGKLTRVQLLGRTHLRRRYLESRVRARLGEPLNVKRLQTALRSLQQDPNVARLDARLDPGDAPGQSVLLLAVDDQPRFSAGIGADNYQSPSIGAEEGRVFFSARDLTGYGDDFNGSVSHSRGNTLGSAVLSIPVSAHDAAVQGYYSRGDAVIIQQPFAQLNIKETVRTYGLLLTVPVVDRLQDRVSLFIGAESDRAFTELLGTGFSFSPGAQNGVSDVTEVLGGLDWLLHGASSVTDLRLTYRRGIDALGATIYDAATANSALNFNATGADGRFGLEQLQFIHIHRLNGMALLQHLNDRAELLLRTTGQLTQQPLLSVAKFPVGGVDTVRGFPENSFVRDQGVAATVELQLPVPGYRPNPGLLNLVVAPFVDYGRSWDKVDADPGNPLNDTATPRYMASAGAGVLWNPFEGLDLQVYWGRGIADNFGIDDPRKFIPHDLQYHGVYFSANYVYHW